jgi:membrane fusion protein, heavy metal efflux system
MKILSIITLSLILTISSITITSPTYASEEQIHTDHDDHGHDQEKGHDHNDGDKHDDSHGHEEHGDDHDDAAPHDHGEGGHEDGEEGKATIKPDAAARAGVVTEKAGPRTIHQTTVLTGRVVLNRDRTYAVRARFPGVVKDVQVRWGQQVSKGQPLASIESNESLKTYSVFAPKDGVVLERNTNIGDVAGDDPLFVVADLSEVWAEFHVFPRDLPNIKEGQKVKVHTLENGKESQGNISMMLPTADALSQTVIAIVPVPNSEGKWRPGMTVEGHVAVSERPAKLAVAEEAVQRLEDKTVVFVKEGEKTYEPREVTLGISDGEYIEVLSGLKVGDEVVSRSSFTIKADILKGSAEHSH